MFKFGFSSSDEGKDIGNDEKDNNKYTTGSSCDDTEIDDKTEWLKSEEVLFDANSISSLIRDLVNCESGMHIFKCENCPEIQHVSADLVVNIIANDHQTILTAEQNHSDLVTGLYEGGLKIWECTYDLVRQICKENIDFCNKKVLDLGCGAGIIGILGHLKQSSCTYFQDYNPEVLKYITIPNVVLNTPQESKDEDLGKCKFYSGDWASFIEVTEEDFQNDDQKFDYIFTSETIYNPQNYRKLCSVFKQRLKRDGTVFLAAKTYYFGVGGSLRQFEDLLVQKDIFEFSTCWTCSEGVQREILKITFKR